MKERPIIFNGPMVRALLNGSKTQTRRVVKPQPYIDEQGNFCWNGSNFGQDSRGPHTQAIASPIPSSKTKRVRCPYGKPLDRLWVREKWRIGAWDETDGRIAVDYSDGPRKEWLSIPDPMQDEGELFNRLWEQSCEDARKVLGVMDRYKWPPGESPCRWRPSIHMPRWASRITLEITGVRVERLQDISEADAVAEGVTEVAGYLCGLPACLEHCYAYEDLWKSIYGYGSWNENPWVWVIEFRGVL